MCVAMCRVRLPLVVKDALQMLQLNALTPTSIDKHVRGTLEIIGTQGQTHTEAMWLMGYESLTG